MVNFRTLKIGDKILWKTDEPFEHPQEATVVLVDSDHAIARTDDNINLWVDDDFASDYYLL